MGAVTGRSAGEADCAASEDDPGASDDVLPHNIVDHPNITTVNRGNVFIARIPVVECRSVHPAVPRL